MEKYYNLPITGKVKNWKSFSGDVTEPIKPIGAKEFVDGVMKWEETPEKERYVNIKAIKYNVDTGMVEVKVISNEEFHEKFSKWLEDKSPRDICKMFGKKQLKFPGPPEHANGQRPEERFTRVW